MFTSQNISRVEFNFWKISPVRKVTSIRKRMILIYNKVNFIF